MMRTKCFILKTELYFTFFYLIWIGIWCYSIKGSFSGAPFIRLFISYNRYNLLGIAKTNSYLRNVHQYIHGHYVIHNIAKTQSIRYAI